MDVVVKLQPDLAAAIRSGDMQANASPYDLLRLFNLSLKPMHASRTTGLLSTYFVVDAPEEVAETVRSKLSEVGGVESAYISPQATLPG